MLSPIQHLRGWAPILPPAFRQHHDRCCRCRWRERLTRTAVHLDYSFTQNDLERLECIYDPYSIHEKEIFTNRRVAIHAALVIAFTGEEPKKGLQDI